MDQRRRRLALGTKGFMPADEGDALHAAALVVGRELPGLAWVEVGSYCGRSTVWLGDAAERCNTVVFAVDHHRGSEENQSGWEHHDVEVVDTETGRMDTLPFFRRTVADADLEGSVVAVVGQSSVVATHWQTPLGLVFIDGGHGEQAARADHENWSPHIVDGGYLAIHDVFPDPADGGRPPYEQIYLPALANGFTEISVCGSLRILRRPSGHLVPGTR